MTGPEEEGREAARKYIGFDRCPYSYGNSGATNMDEYAAMDINAKRDQWYQGWRDEQAALGLDSRFQPLKTPNGPSSGAA